MALSQRLSTPTNSAETATETADTPVPEAATAEETTAPVAEKRKPLLFDPEPSQRMVVVRRRRRRRSQKVNKSDQVAGRLRFLLLGIVIVLLLVAVSGQHFAQAFLEHLKSLLLPIKNVFRVPKLEIVALVIAALILIYMMPGVESTLKRWLGINSSPKQKTR